MLHPAAEAVTAYREALLETTRERVSLQWVTTYVLFTLGARKNDPALLEESVAAR